MTYSPNDGLRSSRNRYVDPPSFTERANTKLLEWAQELGDSLKNELSSLKHSDGQIQGTAKNILKRLITARTLLIWLWISTLWYGERGVFHSSFEGCRWDKWEHWVSVCMSGLHRGILTLSCAEPTLDAPSPRLDRRSSDCRPSYLPGQAMALVNPDNPPYRSLPAPLFQSHPALPTTRLGLFPRRSVRRRKRMGC